jgi:hypothetical protein
MMPWLILVQLTLGTAIFSGAFFVLLVLLVTRLEKRK